MADILPGYRAAYENGVIHRDMSVENILINRVVESVRGNRGFIIDFDYAKFMEAATLHDDPISVRLVDHVCIWRSGSDCVSRELDRSCPVNCCAVGPTGHF